MKLPDEPFLKMAWEGLSKKISNAPDSFLVVDEMLDGKRTRTKVRRKEPPGLIVSYCRRCPPTSSVSIAPLRTPARLPTEAVGGVDPTTPRPPRSRDGQTFSPGRERPCRIGNSRANVLGPRLVASDAGGCRMPPLLLWAPRRTRRPVAPRCPVRPHDRAKK